MRVVRIKLEARNPPHQPAASEGLEVRGLLTGYIQIFSTRVLIKAPFFCHQRGNSEAIHRLFPLLRHYTHFTDFLASLSDYSL